MGAPHETGTRACCGWDHFSCAAREAKGAAEATRAIVVRIRRMPPVIGGLHMSPADVADLIEAERGEHLKGGE